MNILNKDSYVLAAITGTLYLQSFMMLLAQSAFYEIPIQFMSLDVLKITYTSLFFAGIVVVLWVLYLIYSSFKKRKRPIYLRLAILYLILAVPLVALLLLKDISLIAIIIISVLWESLLLWGFLRNKKHYIDVFNGNSWHYHENEGDNEGVIKNFYRFRQVIIGTLIFLAFPGAFLASYITCLKKTDYDVFSKDGYFAIVNYSSDSVIAKGVKNHQLEQGYYIFKTDTIQSKIITKKNIKLIP